MLTKTSKLFFTMFFLTILISVGFAYYRYEIRKDFHSYTENDDIPRAVDFYVNLINKL